MSDPADPSLPARQSAPDRRDHAWLGSHLRTPENHRLAVTLGGYVGRFGLTFITSIIIARWLGPDGYGLIALVAAAFAIADTVGDFGLTYAAIRAVARATSDATDRARELASGYLSLAFLTNTAAAVVGLLFAGPIAHVALGRSETEPYLRIAFIGLISVSGSGFVTAMLQATQRFIRLALIQIFMAATYLAGILLLVAMDSLSVSTVVLLGAVNPLLGFVVGLRLLPRGFVAVSRVAARTSHQTWAELTRFGKWLWISAMLSLLASQLDLLLLAHWATASVVGTYALAFNLAMKLDLINQARLTVLLPVASRLSQGDEMRRYIHQNLVQGCALSLALLLTLPLAGPLIETIYGTTYREAVEWFQLLLAVVIFDLLSTPFLLLAFPLNSPGLLAASDLVRVLTLVLVGVWLIPTIGPAGAVLAKMASRIAGATVTLAGLSQRGRRMARIGLSLDPR
jgi:O-antigen/teichoic acid export membrane protein